MCAPSLAKAEIGRKQQPLTLNVFALRFLGAMQCRTMFRVYIVASTKVWLVTGFNFNTQPPILQVCQQKKNILLGFNFNTQPPILQVCQQKKNILLSTCRFRRI